MDRSDTAPTMDQMNLDELFAPFIPQLYRAAAQVLRHSQDSEDALQEGLLAAFRHLNQFQGRAKFSTWLHTIVVNAAFMKLRRRKGELGMASIDEEFGDDALNFENLIRDRKRNPEEAYADLERSQILVAAIRKVPRRYQAVLQMCDMEGLMEKEVAQRLGILVSVVKSRRYRGRRMLLTRLRHMVPATARARGNGPTQRSGVRNSAGLVSKDAMTHTC